MRANDVDLRQVAKRRSQVVAQLALHLFLENRRQIAMVAKTQNDLQLIRPVKLRIGSQGFTTEAQRAQRRKNERKKAGSRPGEKITTHGDFPLCSLCLSRSIVPQLFQDRKSTRLNSSHLGIS